MTYVTKIDFKFILLADTPEQLHLFAKKINLDGNTFNRLHDSPYYNLRKEKRYRKAILAGAKEIEVKDLPDIFPDLIKTLLP